MKRICIVYGLLILFTGCRNTFIENYHQYIGLQSAAESDIPDAAADYFVSVEDDEGLIVKPSLSFPGKVSATQNRYPDRIEITWHAVSLPDKAASVTYSVYRKNSGDDSSSWARIASDLKECAWTDNAYTSAETEDSGETGNGESAADESGTQKVLLQEGEDYQYAVRAVYTIQKSDTESELQGSRLSYFAVGNLFRNVWKVSSQYRDNLNQITISWYPVPGASYYRIDRASVVEGADTLEWVVVQEKTSQTSYTDYSADVSSVGVSAQEEFRYRVIPFYEENGEPVYARIGSDTVTILGALLAVGAPDAPEILSVSKGDYGSGIKIEWAEMDAMQFRIYRAASPDAPFEPIALTETGAAYYIDDLSSVSSARRSDTYYYKVSARNESGIDGKLSNFDAEKHCGFGFFVEEGFIAASKRIYPQQIDLMFSFEETPPGDVFLIQYTTDNGTSWNWVRSDGTTVPVADNRFSVDEGVPANIQKLIVVFSDGYDQSKDYRFRIRAVKKDFIEDVLSVFDEEDSELYGKSNLIELSAGLSGPEIPVLTVSQGDASIPNQIRISGKWEGMSDYGNYADIQIIRLYSFGKDSDVGKPIAVKSKVVADFGTLELSNGEFTFTDNLAPDINPQGDTIKPMNAEIRAGETWTYWTWDREAWKYINRKLPFDMKAAVGCEYKIVAKWITSGSEEWPDSESVDSVYGYPALTDDDFVHLLLWMREVAMNRIWHLLYPPYHGTMTTTISMLTSPQTKSGEYGGQVGFTAEADGLGGSGKCWITDYSDWGPDWNLNVPEFAIALKYNEIADFNMPITIRTPLYSGKVDISVGLENGMYCDKPKRGSLTVTQDGRPSKKYDNLQNEDSIICRYFPEQSYEDRVGESGTPSYELTTINFKYPLDTWKSHSEDWTMYYGFFD